MDTNMWIFAVALFLLKQVSCIEQHYYCINGQTQNIDNSTVGMIKTRETEQGFYANNLKCSWKLDAGAGQRIKLTVTRMDLQWSPDYTTCEGYDHMDIWEANTDQEETLTSICFARNPYSVITKDRYLFLTFSSTLQNFYDNGGIEIRFEFFTNNDQCPPGWFPAPSSTTECLMIEQQGTVAWDRAQDICTYNKGNLASILSQDEYDTIMAHGVNLTEAWIGLNDLDDNNVFRWIDRQSLTFKRQVTEKRFNYYCVVQNFETGEWVAKKCDTGEYQYVCKARKDGLSMLYPAEEAMPPPEEEEEGSTVFLVVIIAVVVAGLILVTTLGMVIYYRRNGRFPCSSPKPPKVETADTNTGSSAIATTRFSPVHERNAGLSTPKAAPADVSVMLHDIPTAAPPTYADSRYDPILPANY